MHTINSGLMGVTWDEGIVYDKGDKGSEGTL